MSRLLTELLLQDAKRSPVQKEWDESKHPRAEHGRFGETGGGEKGAPGDTRASRIHGIGMTAAGADPRALARAAAWGAANVGYGSRTMAHEAKMRAREAGAGKATDVTAGGLARQAVRREMGGAYLKRPAAAEEIKQQFGAGRGKGGGGAVQPVKPPPAVELKPPPVAPGELSATEHHLITSEVVGMKQLVGGGNVSETHFATFADGSRGVFKPADGAAGRMRSNIQPGQDKEREAGAWQVAKLVGMQDLVPETVIRDVNGRVGSMQNFVNDSNQAYQAHSPFDGARDFTRSAVFDFVIGHEDRHGKNWMVTNSDGKVHLIDNGLAFPESTKLEAVRGFMAAAVAGGGSYGGMRSPAPVGRPADWVKPYTDNKAQILKTLGDLKLPPRAVRGVSERIDMLSKMKTSYGWNTISRGGEEAQRILTSEVKRWREKSARFM